MIETNRLNLRHWQVNDLHDLHAILGSQAVMEFSDTGPLNPSDQFTWLLKARNIEHHSTLPGVLAIEHQAGGTVIGYVSLSRDETRVKTGDAELGFRLAEAFWRQGYATEAANGIIDASKRIAAIERVVAIVDPNNKGSIRVLQKIGMSFETEIVFAGYDYPDHLYVRSLT